MVPKMQVFIIVSNFVYAYPQQQSGTGWKRMRIRKIIQLLLSCVVLNFCYWIG